MRKLLLFLCIAVSLNVSALTVGGLNYTVSGTDATVTGATDNNVTEITIPATITSGNKTYNVVAIGRNAFHSCTKLTKVTIEDCDTPIAGVWYTNSQGFQVQSIPFQNCPLKELYLGRNTSTYTASSISGHIPLKNAGSELRVYVGGKTTQINFTTFQDTNITHLTIGGSVLNIYKNSFRKWLDGNRLYHSQSNIKKVVIERGDEPIQFEVSDEFSACELDTVEVYRQPFGNGSTRSRVFASTPIKHVIYGASVLGDETFYGSQDIQTFRLLNTCETLGSSITFSEAKIKEFYVEDGENALTWKNNFYSTNLDSLYVGRPMTDDSNTPLAFNFKPKSICFGPLVKSIRQSFADGHSELERVYFSENLESIGERAFYSCKNLKTALLPNSISEIGKEAFANCTALESMTIPTSLTTIPESIFRYCASLSGRISIPETVTRIGANAFSSTGISEIIFEDSEGEIYLNPYLLTSCKLTKIYFGRQPVPEGTSTLLSGAQVDSIIYGSQVRDIPSDIGHSACKVKHIEISENVNTINDHVYQSCKELLTIESKNPVPLAPANDRTKNYNFSTDNYNTVILTVPVGTKRNWQAAEIWQNFKNIRSEAYYVRVDCDKTKCSVTINEVQTDEALLSEHSSATIRIVPAEEYEIDNIKIDGEPADHIDGEVAIPELENDTDIAVTMKDIPSGIDNISYDSTETISVYTLDGSRIYTGHANGMPKLPAGIYILVTPSETQKLKI